jgi:hypothetical protein
MLTERKRDWHGSSFDTPEPSDPDMVFSGSLDVEDACDGTLAFEGEDRVDDTDCFDGTDAFEGEYSFYTEEGFDSVDEFECVDVFTANDLFLSMDSFSKPAPKKASRPAKHPGLNIN